MDCARFREVLDLHADRELAADAMVAAHVHRLECVGCMGVWCQLQALRGALRETVSSIPIPPDMEAGVREALGRGGARRRLTLSAAVRAAAAALIVWVTGRAGHP